MASSVYVSEQMWDFTTDTNLLFKDDIGTVLYYTEAKFIVPDRAGFFIKIYACIFGAFLNLFYTILS